ncbi:hypothetical protein CONCODRAFT_20762 [Conidiobolus coronatus NRRL 28638]|uniref:F-box domain-containing protein n=1 Tax=Conidiobolus coronatus (strain ATCC 28846 / CBS 209.66 / NRRL 28638) TaxID=796925 RepID=A0A137NRK9_CONC2|nr:hypothetical protein CONCODRAFT_20762 [Conidiobolus coronatus NRRL 28638]|eukprot:KXN65367.1 hypothetical protein CONCODRAFT_20762 [Conidiobolus coronatus NRRL 28638]
MSTLYWKNIFKLPEFKQYFSNTEIIQLSTACKYFRTSLNSTILKNFNFNLYIKENCYSSCLISEEVDNYQNNIYRLINIYKPLNDDLLESKNRFKSELYMTGYYSDRIILNYTNDYYYLFSEIPSLFKNLRSLVITRNIIMLDTLKYLLDNLNCLEDLELIDNKLYKHDQDLNGNSINWPTTLKKLKIGSNIIGHVSEGGDSIVLCPSAQPNGDFTRLRLLPVNIPNLVSLYYRSSFYDDDNDDDDDEDDEYNCNELIEFLNVNHNIVKLYIGDSAINLALINTIYSLQNLMHLELPSIERFLFSYMEYFNSPAHANLRSLKLTLYEDLHFLGILATQFPNLAYLTLGTMQLQSNNLLAKVSKFQKLKNFKLHVYLTMTEGHELNFESFLNLKSFELISDSKSFYESIKWKLPSCSKLRLIKFSLFENYDEFNTPKLIPELKENWKLVYFTHKLSYYKIN